MGAIADNLKKSRITIDGKPKLKITKGSLIEVDESIFIGWRIYGLRWRANGLALHGTIIPWDRPTLSARCEQYKQPALSPQEKCRNHLLMGKCSCGIYARDTLQDNEYWDPRSRAVQIITRCVAWGAVYKASYGWRAENVRIEQMWLGEPPGNDFIAICGSKTDRNLSWEYGFPSDDTCDKLGLIKYTIPEALDYLSDKYGMRCGFGAPK